jgi:hypothetical protein
MAAISFATRTNFNVNAVKLKIEALAAERARQACEGVAPIAIELIAAGAPRSKDGRHRSKSLTDPGSYSHDVSRQARGVRLNIHVMGDEKFKAKFFSINYGSGGHPITGNYWLSFPGTNDYAGIQVVTHSVGHPGTSGTGFYEDGIRQAIAMIPSWFS